MRHSSRAGKAWFPILTIAVVITVVLFLNQNAAPRTTAGWCCLRQGGNSCEQTANATECGGKGGYAFSVDQAMCIAACAPSPLNNATP